MVDFGSPKLKLPKLESSPSVNCTISNRLFGLLCQPLLAFLDKAVVTHRADYRARKFKAATHLLVTLFAHLTQVESSNALLEALNDLTCSGQEPGLRALVGFNFTEWGQPVTLNQSSFSRAMAHRSYRLWKYCFHRLYHLAGRHCSNSELAGLGRVIAVDGTLLDCLGRMAWAAYRTTTHKLKGHLFFDLAGIPERLVLTVGRGSEREVLRTHLKPEVTYLLDRGYNDYILFEQIVLAGSHFVTRLLKNALYWPQLDYPVSYQAEQLGVISDQQIRLGDPYTGPLFRLVVYCGLDGKEYRYITSRFDVDSLTIVRLYEWRWQIERFFAWAKRHLQFAHWYSENENGVLIQLYAGLISFLLLKIYATHLAKDEYRAMRLDFVRWVRRHLFSLVEPSQFKHYLELLFSPDLLNQSSPSG